jgi:hypothetical protein
MWLIFSSLAAIVTTVIWYISAPKDPYKVGLLSLAFWGATIMWLVDHIMAYASTGGEFFEVDRDATMLGVSVIVVALVAWLLVLVISDPKGVISRAIRR